MRRIAHIDVNAFYCSCERLFRPDLAETPLVVLSNNDGCVVARDSKVKALGIPMGQPWFELRPLARKHGIRAFSSNYTLYGDMSRRVMSVIAQFAPDQEIYSIDESFLDLTPQPRLVASNTGKAIRERVLRWTGLPVCVGIGETKTLAKYADWLAKHDNTFGGVCDLTTMPAEERNARMAATEVRETWGIGRRLAERLRADSVYTIADLAKADARRLRERYGVVVERTARELSGIPCLELESPTPKKQIIASRSFGGPVYTLEALAEPIRQYMGRAAEKLRRQSSTASVVGVWIETNRFRKQDSQYTPSATLALAEPSDDSIALTETAMRVLRAIYRPSYRYVKAGVMLLDLRDRVCQQGQLFSAPPERAELMRTLDKVNAKWGRGTLGLGSAGLASARSWTMNRQMLSPRYTTCWNELPVVRA